MARHSSKRVARKTPTSSRRSPKKNLKNIQKLNTFLLMFILVLLLKPWHWDLAKTFALEIEYLYTIIPKEWR